MLKLAWPAPAQVHAIVTQAECTTAEPGFSSSPYGRFNLATHVGDACDVVAANRLLLTAQLNLGPVQWLEQVHGVAVYKANTRAITPPPMADGVYTTTPNAPIAVLTADCLPVFFCARAGDEIAVAHAGWRGLAAGVLARTLESFSAAPSQIMAYLGPAIGPVHFEVGQDVRDAFEIAFATYGESIENCFLPSQRKGHFLADLYALARAQLRALGVRSVFGGEFCTYSDAQFYSFRRATHVQGDGRCGRMASVIWLSN